MIIGLTGYAGVGKDTVANILRARHGYKRYAFADALKRFAYELNPIVTVPNGPPMRVQDIVDAYGWDSAKWLFPEIRPLLQRAGVWFRENVDKNYWVNVVAERWYADGCPNAVVTDVRFPNEVAWVRSAGGYVVRVNRDGVGPANGHVSERAEDLYRDFDVDNSGSLDDLAAELDRVIAKIKERDAIR